jgi:uncharacterized protein with GYD domain
MDIENFGNKEIIYMFPLNIYYTLGRYDVVVIFEAPDEKIAMKMAMSIGDIESTETLVAVPREEAMKLVE